MKGQIIFQFIIAAVIFFSIVLFIITYLNSTVSAFGNDAFADALQAKAAQISEVLVKNPGVWNGSTPAALGIAAGWPVLNQTKMELLGKYCSSDFEGLRRLLGLDERVSDFSEKELTAGIKIFRDNIGVLDCGPDPPSARTGSVKRFAVSEDGRLLSIEVFMW